MGDFVLFISYDTALQNHKIPLQNASKNRGTQKLSLCAESIISVQVFFMFPLAESLLNRQHDVGW